VKLQGRGASDSSRPIDPARSRLRSTKDRRPREFADCSRTAGFLWRYSSGS
jgi:hypothetical protein